MPGKNSLDDFELFYEELLQHKDRSKKKKVSEDTVKHILATRRRNRFWVFISTIFRRKQTVNRSTRMGSRRVNDKSKNVDGRRSRSTRGTTSSKKGVLNAKKTTQHKERRRRTT